MSKRFAIGDVVQLKSGGPAMTLRRYIIGKYIIREEAALLVQTGYVTQNGYQETVIPEEMLMHAPLANGDDSVLCEFCCRRRKHSTQI